MALTHDLRCSVPPLMETGVIDTVTAQHSELGDDLIDVTVHLVTKRRAFDTFIAATLKAHERPVRCTECGVVRCVCVPSDAPARREPFVDQLTWYERHRDRALTELREALDRWNARQFLRWRLFGLDD